MSAVGRAQQLTRELQKLEARKLVLSAERLTLVRQLVEEGQTPYAVAQLLGVHHTQVYRWLGQAGPARQQRPRS